MSLLKCPECAGNVSSDASACPHCGKPNVALAEVLKPSAGAPAAKNASNVSSTFLALTGVTVVVALAFVFGFGDDPPAPKVAIDLDHSTTSVATCDWEKLRDQVGELAAVSWADQSRICGVMQTSMGHFPTVGQLRRLSTVAMLMSAKGSPQKEPDLAYQIMNVVEARGQTDATAIDETFETVWKVFSGSNGLVTPKDLNINLRSAGPLAKTLNQEGVFGLAAMIQADKKSRGE